MEVAIVLLIIAGLSTSIVTVYKTVFNTDHKLEEQRNINQIGKALNTFLAVNSYVPCPDTDGDGLENRMDSSGISVCSDREGGLPFNDLGVKDKDAWGNAYYYRVHQRAVDGARINDICEPASVLGKSGSRSKVNLAMCPDTNVYYCAAALNNCDDACTSLCTIPTTTIDPRPATGTTSAPFFHLATPPFGSVSGSLNIQITDEAGTKIDEGVVAVVLSWGANGSAVNDKSCVGGTASEFENCNDDRNFVNIKTGENQDFMTWVTVSQAKVAIIGSGSFR